MERVVCPAQAGDPTPPNFSAADCRRMSFLAVDTQHASLWRKASINVPRGTLEQTPPLGLFASGKAASTAWVNGRRIGGNGEPGIDAASETPGLMDAVIPIPHGVLKAGANEIVLQLSDHHGFLRLANPLHMLAIGVYTDWSQRCCCSCSPPAGSRWWRSTRSPTAAARAITWSSISPTVRRAMGSLEPLAR